MQLCPCHSQLPYEECCGKFHRGSLPKSALELMRSRYSAYALGLVNYIIETTHVDNPHYRRDLSAWKKELAMFCKQTRFENLEILYTQEEGNFAVVSFKATLKQALQDVSFTEISSFKREGKKWFYLNKDDKKKFKSASS